MGDTTPLSAIKPTFTPSPSEPPAVQALVTQLSLAPHVEGGYFVETDSSPITIPSPYPVEPQHEDATTAALLRPGYDPSLRRLSTTIFYFLSPARPLGTFHRNRSRIVHTLHSGRGRYVLLHPGGRVETFVVGHDVAAGERLQWVVDGGIWKASFLLPDHEGTGDAVSGGLLISETVVPGFEFADHEFLSMDKCKALLPESHVKELEWLVRKN